MDLNITKKDLKNIRIKYGLTQTQMAGILGYGSHHPITQFEKGRKTINSRLKSQIMTFKLKGIPEEFLTIVGAKKI